MELEALTMAASTAVVGAMSTSLWEQTRAVAVGWWRQVHPERADVVDAELVEAGGELATAREAGDEAAEAELAADLVAEWERRLRRLLVARPGLADEVRRAVDELTARQPEPASPAPVRQEVNVSHRATAYVAGRDQHFDGR
ncbi:hypothetical protein [Streptomyces sp. NPDC007369]|uniref:hypothetical protein n=1 Tax=Streptomyces sp. NPDC007369 TaxID=3154589 RepID=UPI0033CF46E6